jgi:hypothetical protein
LPRQILSLVRLPISPLSQFVDSLHLPAAIMIMHRSRHHRAT